jgi:hypothetical protein
MRDTYTEGAYIYRATSATKIDICDDPGDEKHIHRGRYRHTYRHTYRDIHIPGDVGDKSDMQRHRRREGSIKARLRLYSDSIKARLRLD